MARSNSFMIPRTSDVKLDKVFRGLATKWAFSDGTADLGLGVHTKCGFNGEPSEEWATAVRAKGHRAVSLSVQYGGLTVTFYRGGSQEPKSAFLDEVHFSWNAQAGTGPTPLERVEIASWLERELGATDPRKYPGVGLTPEQHQLEAIHNEVLTRLEQATAHSIEQTEEYRRALDARFEEKVAQAQRDFDEKTGSLEKAIADRQAALQEAERKLADKLAEVDARDNTFARREIRDRMLEETKRRVDNFGVTPRTEEKRRPVRRGMLALILVFASVLLATVVELVAREALTLAEIGAGTVVGAPPASDSPGALGTTPPQGAYAQMKAGLLAMPVWWLWVRLAFAVLATSAAVVYYVRWQNAWAQRHADAEFQLQQFHLDVNRANWVIETCLEWKKETENAPIPAELLASLTRNLFQDLRNQPDQVLHPADELASAILGTASHLKLKTAGAEIDLKNPGKRLPARVSSNSSETASA